MILYKIVTFFGGYNRIRKIYKRNKSRRIKLVCYWLVRCIEHETNSSLPLTNFIDGDIQFTNGIDHIVIDSHAIIGKNCHIHKHVTIGSKLPYNAQQFGQLTIGDNCIIHTGVVIKPTVQIGNNCIIGAYVLVEKNLADNSKIFADSAECIKQWPVKAIEKSPKAISTEYSR
jgi:serine acetyltransferase